MVLPFLTGSPVLLNTTSRRKITFLKKYKKSNFDYCYSISYRTLVKTTIKADRLAWLAYIDKNLKTQPNHFWKYISKFKKNDQAVTQLELGTKIITEPQSIAEAFSDHFPTVFDFSCHPKSHFF
jgi:hypothetical protein